ncbi:hypothetical protein MMC26_005116 [Xylographa opegraphella]|nr:hypothetical protein [Xylographa opegraphella]
MDQHRKRKAGTGADIGANTDHAANKKCKGSRAWQGAKKGRKGPSGSGPSIEAGDAGIWATCDKNTEGKCTAELRDLFNEYAERIYGHADADAVAAREDDEAEEEDIEADIKHEIEGLQTGHRTPLFQPVRLEVQCVLFFKTRPPVEPVSFVHGICTDAMNGTLRTRSRCVRRLSPMTLMGKATEKSLDEISRAVLAPHFHVDGMAPTKFAIRFSSRNHDTLRREAVIKQVADAVGSRHPVDLSKYDALVLVEIYKVRVGLATQVVRIPTTTPPSTPTLPQHPPPPKPGLPASMSSGATQNMCGMSVVPHDFEQLKRYNLAEIYHATRAGVASTKDTGPDGGGGGGG